MGNEMEEKQLLQALVIAESFDDSFEPITHDIAKTKINLVNTPLIDYTLDWLQRCEIDEAIVYCRAQPHADAIREHCRYATERRVWNAMKVTVVASENCDGLGDAMRDLYEKAVLKSNFFLIYGDVISNIDLQQLLKKHKEIQEKDKTAIMTCAYMPGPQPRAYKKFSNLTDLVTLLVSGESEKILHHCRRKRNSRFSIPTQTILRYGEVSIRPNFIDPCIAVCSEVVPSLFSDNFDYRTRDNFINGVVEQEELLGYSIYAHVVTEGYARRVTSFHAYQHISEDVIARRACPLVPEISLTSHRVRYSYDNFHCNYWETSSKFHKKNFSLGNVIGAGSDVSLGVKLVKTVIGDHCTVHDNVVCKNSFIQSNVTIHSGCDLQQCYVANDVTLFNNVTLKPGCVVGPGVKLGPNIVVPSSTKLSNRHPLLNDRFRDQSEPLPAPDPQVCGAKGTAYVYTSVDDVADDCQLPVWGTEEHDSSFSSEDEDYSDDDDDDAEGGIDATDPGVMRDEDEEQELEFKHEVNDSLLNAYTESSLAEKVILEINASRHAYNVSMECVLETVVKGILCIDQHESINAVDGKLWPLIKKALTLFAGVLKNYVKKPRDQILVLKSIEELSSEDKYLSLAQRILHDLNQDLEIVDDEVIIHWFRNGGSGTSAFTNLSKSIEKMVEWLEESDEDSDE